MAKVEMDLAELKQLEKQIEDLKVENKKLTEDQKSVIIYHKYYTGKVKVKDGIRLYLSKNWYDRIDDSPNYGFDELVKKGIIELNTDECYTKSSKTYSNLEDVKRTLRSEIKEQFLDNETKLENNVRSANSEISRLKNEKNSLISEHNQQLETQKEEFNKSLEPLKQKHLDELKEKDKNYQDLKKEFEDFKEDKKVLTQEEKISNLQKELDNLLQESKRLNEYISKIKKLSLFARIFKRF